MKGFEMNTMMAEWSSSLLLVSSFAAVLVAGLVL